MADRKVEKAAAEFRNSVSLAEAPRVQRYHLASPIVASMQHDGTAASDGAGDTNIWHFVGGNYLYTVPIVGQTLTNPVATTTGLDVTGDNTNNDGREITSASSLCKGQDGRDFYTVGGGAFYTKITCTIADISDFDDIRFGFRKNQAFGAAQDDYDDVAGFKIVAGDISTIGILDDGTEIVTDTTVNITDGSSVTMEIKVDNAGNVTTLLNGDSYPVYSTGTTDLVLAAGEEMCMYWYHLKNGANTALAVQWTALEHGLDASRSDKTIVLT